MNTNKEPIVTIEVRGYIYAVGWKNEHPSAKGVYITETAEVYRRYKKSNGEWISSPVFKVADIPLVILALKELWKKLNVLPTKEKVEG